MIYARDAVEELISQGLKPVEIAREVGVTDAMISVWKNRDNDFCPRIAVAKKFYDAYEMVLYPYDERALDGTA